MKRKKEIDFLFSNRENYGMLSPGQGGKRLEIYPDYYSFFRCKGAKCTDNCCVGWEIDIDRETFQYYQSLKGPLGDALRENILSANGVYAFILQEDRCPFLDGDFLCRIQKELGEEALCEICREHPRFYRSYFDVEEMGLALACERVSEILLSKETPTVFWETGEKHLSSRAERAFTERKRRIALLQNRSMSLFQRAALAFGLKRGEKRDGYFRVLDLLLSLNHMDERFAPFLLDGKKRWEQDLPALGLYHPKAFQKEYEEIAVYFLYRYGMKEYTSLWAGFSAFLALFSVVSVSLFHLFSQAEELSKRVADVVWFSKEVEYDEENIERLYASYQKNPAIAESLLSVFRLGEEEEGLPSSDGKTPAEKISSEETI